VRETERENDGYNVLTTDSDKERRVEERERATQRCRDKRVYIYIT
jgi:hypothetical protein